jgi:hypothetical protein
MNLAVRLYANAPSNPLNVPGVWPEDVVDLGDGTTLPDNSYQLMTDTQLLAYRSVHQQVYDAWYTQWLASQPVNKPLPMEVTVSQKVTTAASSPINEHSMQPCGSVKARFVSNQWAFPITLSNKSEDGYTFNYNADFPLKPRIGDYIFELDFCTRAWITSVDEVNKTLILDRETVRPTLNEGTLHYAKGFWIDFDVPDWSPTMFLWGLTFKSVNDHDNYDDFVELSIVDTNDFFKDDDFCNQMFGVPAAQAEPYLLAMGFEQNGEYGHWTKYYDESWVTNVNGRTILTPDGAPGELMSHMKCRISYFTSKIDSGVTDVYLDYFFTTRS